jgi:tRNA G10  N-methylase Trm11
VADARLLANLAFVHEGGKLLDPFAGAGGIVLAALGLKQDVFSLDIDPFVKWGLRHQGARHAVGDARRLPFRDETFDSIASELPFEARHDDMGDAMSEIARTLQPDGRVAIMVVEHQAATVRDRAGAGGLTPVIDIPIDRKGLDVIVLAWTKTM